MKAVSLRFIVVARTVKRTSCTEPTNKDERSRGLTSGLANGTAEDTVFIPAPFPVQGDCLVPADAMVWEVVTPAVLSGDRARQSGRHSEPEGGHAVMMDADGDQSHDLLLCEERLSSSPGFPTSDSYMEYDDLPDLQEVREEAEPAAPPIYQVDVGVSHQERHARAQPPDTHWLTQLAHIATGPQSPLLRESPVSSSSPACLSSTSSNLHSYARPPLPLTPSPPRGHGRIRRRTRKSSECGSAVSTRSSLSDEEDMGWSFSCPPTAWHCFLKDINGSLYSGLSFVSQSSFSSPPGTRLRFHRGSNVEWQDVEGLVSAEEDSGVEERSGSLKSYGCEGLQLVEHSETVLSGQAVLQLTFDPGAFGHAAMTARCQLDHPFYVRKKGWSSFHPSLTVVRYGIPCYEMEVGDVCLPPGHRDAKHTDNSLVFDTFRSYDFTPLDSSAVYVLSSMARRRRASQSSGGAASPDRDPSQDGPGHSHSPRQKPTKSQQASVAGSNNATPTRCKRPMNAFMLFAKKFRVEYTRMYPGKDNRAISVLLGERWKKMRSEERRTFTVQAKALADEQKRINPDCWKRKRTNSGCQGN
ncbi:HMG box-containing protein 1-like isoform X2 [Cyclopterus lumpus]|uniref:HMG box-containing protein 1-like isoform X2 n=1 Tax=Cyclopterus lumpus TaxID=8103 RepID=UPI001485DA7C|nr:HMG box-containing protein 1-like isoform X2 [Cyclopterus lumpus]